MFMRKRKVRRFKFSVVVVVVVAVVGMAMAYIFPLNVVDGRSMLPTLCPGDVILTSRLSKVNRGDIVVGFLNYDAKKELVVKRVLAVEGDTIEIQKDKVIVNNRIVYEDYTLDATMKQTMKETTVETGKLFVLGDNRNDSCDSRSAGCMNADECIGVVKRVISTAH